MANDPKSEKTRLRVLGKWQQKGYTASDEEKAEYADAQKAVAEQKPAKKK